MNISSAPCSGADSAGRNENSINTADCPTSAGLGTPWRWQMLLWIPETPPVRGNLSPGTWGAGEGHLGHLSLTGTCWIPRKGVRRNLSSVSIKSQTCLFWAVDFLSSSCSSSEWLWMVISGMHSPQVSGAQLELRISGHSAALLC